MDLELRGVGSRGSRRACFGCGVMVSSFFVWRLFGGLRDVCFVLFGVVFGFVVIFCSSRGECLTNRCILLRYMHDPGHFGSVMFVIWLRNRYFYPLFFILHSSSAFRRDVYYI